jgi:MurNAc alpha-1-phosphate uridylyltransferase
MPKPLVPVAGRALIDRMLDRLTASGVARAVVNTHHRAQMIDQHLDDRGAPAITLSHEIELLDTGGGVARALADLGGNPFYCASSDVVLIDGATPALDRLAAAWRDDDMDALLLVMATDRAIGFDGPGDFFLDDDGRLRRRAPAPTAPYVFTSVQIIHPRLFEDHPGGSFSLNLLWDRAAAQGRLHGLAHDGDWLHVGTLDGLAAAERFLAVLKSEG